MICITRLGAIVLAALATAPQAASASVSTPTDLQTKIRATLRSATSFVQTVTIKPNPLAPVGGTMTFTVVAPNRFHQVVVGAPGGPDDTIIIGHEVYGRKGQGWDVQTWSDFLVTGFEEDIFNVKVLSVGPDQTADGKTVGTYVMKDPRGRRESDTLACTYDPTTFRPLGCSSDLFIVKYVFDDPSTTIETPKNAVRVDK